MTYDDAAGLVEHYRELLAPHVLRFEPAGAFRRGCQIIGALDLVVIPKMETMAVDLFETKEVKSEGFVNCFRGKKILKGNPGQKYFQIDENGFTVNISNAMDQNWGIIMMIRTGPEQFVRLVAMKWRNKGYASEEGILYKMYDFKKTPIYFKEEHELFEFLGERYIEPKNRN